MVLWGMLVLGGNAMFYFFITVCVGPLSFKIEKAVNIAAIPPSPFLTYSKDQITFAQEVKYLTKSHNVFITLQSGL